MGRAVAGDLVSPAIRLRGASQRLSFRREFLAVGQETDKCAFQQARMKRRVDLRLDIVIPAHNEERRIGPMLEAYRSRCSDPETRFVVALDRCRDRTADIVRNHRAADPRVQIVHYPKLGKGGVLMEAFRRCDADFIGFVDADCATPPSELVRLAEAAQRADGAIATRRHPAAVLPAQRPLTRRLTSAGFAFGIRKLFRLPYGDTQCGAKVLRRGLVEKCLPLMSSRDFLFDVDLLFVARRLGFRVVEVPTIWIDQAGSRVHARSDTLRMAFSAMRLWLHHRVIPVDLAAGEPVREDTLAAEHVREVARVPS
jgi:glycosyltransferase involved in cell wall biosynthesis